MVLHMCSQRTEGGEEMDDGYGRKMMEVKGRGGRRTQDGRRSTEDGGAGRRAADGARRPEDDQDRR